MKMFTRMFAATAGILIGAIGTATVASATEESEPYFVESECTSEWYVNPDEGGSDPQQGDRRPEQTEDGLLFSGNMLVHHTPESSILLADLEPGSFTADPAPSLDSFFSVEVGAPGYATLRWDGTQWNVGGTDNYSIDPSTFVGVKGLTAESRVLSFGVGYVNTPNDGTETTVSSVTFDGATYDLTCAPEPEPTETAATPAPTTETPAVVAEEELALTGTSTGIYVLAGGALVAMGAAFLVIGRLHRRS